MYFILFWCVVNRPNPESDPITISRHRRIMAVECHFRGQHLGDSLSFLLPALRQRAHQGIIAVLTLFQLRLKGRLIKRPWRFSTHSPRTIALPSKRPWKPLMVTFSTS